MTSEMTNPNYDFTFAKLKDLTTADITEYQITLPHPYTIKKFINEILKDKKAWGDIIISENKYDYSMQHMLSYENGEITQNSIPDDILTTVIKNHILATKHGSKITYHILTGDVRDTISTKNFSQTPTDETLKDGSTRYVTHTNKDLTVKDLIDQILTLTNQHGTIRIREHFDINDISPLDYADYNGGKLLCDNITDEKKNLIVKSVYAYGDDTYYMPCMSYCIII